MERFVFRFGTILNTKEKIEDDRKNKLGISMKRLASEKEHLQMLFKKKDDMINQWQERSENVIKISDLRNLSNSLDIMRNIIDKQLNVVEESKTDTEIKRKDLLEASKQKKVFEKLKEKDYEEHKYNQLKKEYALTDEIVSYKAANR